MITPTSAYDIVLPMQKYFYHPKNQTPKSQSLKIASDIDQLVTVCFIIVLSFNCS